MKNNLVKIAGTIILSVLCIGSLFACGGQNETLIKEEPTKVVRTDVNIAYSTEPQTLDQHKSTSIATAVIIRNIYGNLFRLNYNDEIVPELAESYEANSSNTEFTIKLKEGILFSDGTPITAEDVKYTFDRAKSYGLVVYDVIESVRVIDDRTVKITTQSPEDTFIKYLTLEYMCIMSKKAIESGMDVENNPTVVSGAYTFESRSPGKAITLAANPNFVNGEPPIKKATIWFDSASMYEGLLSGKYDYITSVSSDVLDGLNAVSDYYVIGYDNLSWNYMALNQQNPYLKDKNVRTAIYYALDLDYIIDFAIGGDGNVAPIMATDTIKGYVSGYDNNDYNLKLAKEYMKKSNYPDGFDMKLLHTEGNRTRELVTEAIKSQLKEIGINVIEETTKTTKARIVAGEFDAVLWSNSMSIGNINHAIPLFREGDPMHYSFSKTDTDIADGIRESARLTGTARENVLKTKVYDRMKEEHSYIGLYWPTIFDVSVEALSTKEPVHSEVFEIDEMYWE